MKAKALIIHLCRLLKEALARYNNPGDEWAKEARKVIAKAESDEFRVAPNEDDL